MDHHYFFHEETIEIISFLFHHSKTKDKFDFLLFIHKLQNLAAPYSVK